MSRKRLLILVGVAALALVWGMIGYFVNRYHPHRGDDEYPFQYHAPHYEYADLWTDKADAQYHVMATQEGNRLVLSPSGASLTIPDSWLDWQQMYHDNIHIIPQALQTAMRPEAGENDPKYASIVNAILPQNSCAAHLGGRGWGPDGVSFGAVQMRVYDVRYGCADLADRIEEKGADEMQRLLGYRPRVNTRTTEGEWHRSELQFVGGEIDYSFTARVAFWFRVLGNRRTLVLVFMCADHHAPADETIREIVDSVKVK